jgi:hypothetical protein
LSQISKVDFVESKSIRLPRFIHEVHDQFEPGLIARLDWIKPISAGLIGTVVIFSGENAFAWPEKTLGKFKISLSTEQLEAITLA